MDASRRCPDCGVGLEAVRYDTSYDGHRIRIADDDDDGILSRLKFWDNTYAHGYVCPECGLVRFYAE